jgi:phosphate transport system permease protein
MTATAVPDSWAPPTRRRIVSAPTRGDRVFRSAATACGMATLVLLGLIGMFLLQKGLPELRNDGWHFVTGKAWTQAGPFGIAAVLYWTVVIALIALVVAVPVSVAVALTITELAPRRLRRPLVSMIDLLAAVPSLLYGLWGLFVLQPRMAGTSRWLSTHLGWFPLFKADSPNFKSSALIAGTVVALMIVPIITSVVREVFAQVPATEKEAALALGGTRWGMIRKVVLPFGRGGIVGGAMLGLGRALGETIAVVLIISPSFVISPHILESGANSIASLIALRIGDAHGIAINALMAAGLALFVLTLIVNMAAAAVVSRSRSGSGTEL